MKFAFSRFWPLGSVRRQLIAGVALVHAVMMSLFIWDLTHRQQEMLLDQQISHARALVRSVATSSAGWLLSRDVTGLQEIVDAQAGDPDLRFAMALDLQGKILAHSDRRYLGKYLADQPAYPVLTVLHQSPSLVDIVNPVMVANEHVGWIRIGLGQKDASQRQAKIFRDGVLYALAAILIGGLLAGYMGTRLTRRLYAIRSVADAVESGNSSLRAPDEGTDEAALLARRFNGMLDTLAKREHELMASNQALHESEARFQRALQGASDGLWDWDLQTNHVFYSPRWKAMLGYRDDELESHLSTWEKLVDPEDKDRTLANVQLCLDGEKETFESEFRMRHKAGHWVHILARGYLERDTDGQPLRLTGTHVDITERKMAEEALRLTQFSLDHAPEGVFWIKNDGSVEYVNDTGALTLGRNREEIIGMHVWDFDPDIRAEMWSQQWESTRQAGTRTFETRHRHKDGTIHPVEISVVYTTYGDKEHHTAFVRDITQRKRDEAVLRQDREQQAVLREMLEYVVKDAPLKATLETCLTRLMQVSWLSLLPQAGIFLMDEDRQNLHLIASSGLAPQILNLCDRVPLGKCHCGRAASSREMQFSQCVDHHHEISYPGMLEHGHYNLPLISEGEVLGVMVLYLPHGFVRDPAKEQFLGTLADALAGYVRRKGAEDALRLLNEELEDRVEWRTVELVAAKDQAERASRAKSEFLSRMSHELRTPLNAILGFGQLLEMDQLEDEQAENVQEILHAGRHLLDLINEVLDLARIEAGRLTISQEPVPLFPLVEECLTLIRPMAEKHGIGIIATGQDCGEQVRADRTRLKQVLLNLLSNAVKYNRASGSIGITCMHDDGTVQVRISDTGKGLSPEQQTRLFSPFERLDADQDAIEGTGIGLALSKRLVELMAGEIGVESTPGVGSTFWVRLPLSKGHGQLDEEINEWADPDTEVPDQPKESRQWDVLCIEDNPANLRLIERILSRRNDVRLLTANTPTLGLELAMTHQPALILLDINLPEMDGYDVMECLQENSITRDIPVVAVSANAMPKDLARGKAAGFLQYLTKPLSVEKLQKLIDEIAAKPVGNKAQGESE